ncbi:polysaccharide export protein [Mesorhizobium sp. RP14(2022)]|uniref:Polysaccharide export protein n=1 Tax=Mesorhizobium liriopis TaxID=2953882 RepID=A0ABT1CAA9_9HYPH|nr:polysaccharide biosynthesis/export family protein [Mesorhizobium liriopis]MCO6051768.1 polysaccharide export protein [Mesorhizobium liriopis]
MKGWRRTGSRALIVAGALGLLSACTTAGSGPSAGAVERTARASAQGKFPVVELGDFPLAYSTTTVGDGLAALGNSKYNGNVLRAGDTIDVKIFDTGTDGLLSSAESKALQLGTFRIDNNGSVNLPFAGRVRAAGSSPSALQDRIAGSLRGSSVSPQASVYVTESGSSGFTVSGDVKGAGRFNLSPQGEKVLDAIAMGGGPASPPGELEISVLRGARSASASMERVLSDPRQNIHVQPNDQIFVRRQASSFTSFGAFKSPGEFNFEPGRMSMAQAVARAGGLLDDRANPKKVYLFRYEPAAVARSLGVAPASSVQSPPVPMVYLVDMTKTPSFFQMQSFQMRAGDVLYVPNTASANLGKAFQVFQKAPPTAAAPLPE